MPQSLLFIIAAVFAEAIGTFTGFGATTILLPIATFLMPLKDAIVLVGLFHLFGTGFRTLFFARKVKLNIALIFGLPSLIFSYLGASFLKEVSADTLTRIIGAALILYAFYSLFGQKIKLPKSNVLLAGGGGVVGFIAGLIGTAGALRGAFLTSWGLAPEVYLGTTSLMGLGADATRVLAYWKSGLIDFIGLNMISILAITALIGTLVGKLLVSKIKPDTFSKIIFVALILAGARLLLIQ